MSKRDNLLDMARLRTGHLGQRLRHIRKLAGITQVELAVRLKIGQTALSRLEQRPDMLVSTMRGYLEAVGADVRIDAILGEPDGYRAAGLSSTQGEQLLLPMLGDWPIIERRDLVLSVKPEYSGKIVKGEKTIELRRRFPTKVSAGTLVMIYETSPTRAIIGVAEIADVLTGSTSAIWKQFSHQACIGRSNFDSYFAGTKDGFAIRLRGARRLSRALGLQELRERFSFEPPQSFLYATPELREALSHECSKILN
ncbi:MAG TPA: helix-turn-helix domain-containing protein [Devosia sp.]|nr:helix-turn-helix domain-containing protein [Devosia sp.]